MVTQLGFHLRHKFRSLFGIAITKDGKGCALSFIGSKAR